MQLAFSFPIQGPTLDQQIITNRLRARLNLWEFFSLSFCIAFVGIFIWLIKTQNEYPADFQYYMEKEVSSVYFFYGYWILPYFKILQLLHYTVAYGLFSMINIIGAFFSLRVFGGKPYFVLLSYQLLTSLYYGQIAGIIAGGLALCWWGIAQKNWGLAGLGLLIASTKYQVGLLGLILIWYSGISWKDFLKILVVPIFVGLITLVIYPLWPLEILKKLSMFSFIHLGITLWVYIGGWALLFWLPAFLLPLTKQQRFFTLFTLTTFATPYFQHIDLITCHSLIF